MYATTFFKHLNLSFLLTPIESSKSSTKSSTNDKSNNNLREHTHVECDLMQSSFTYDLCCFIVLTKDERTLLIKLMTNDDYSVYNADTKVYEPLKNYQLNDFIIASATNIVLCLHN